MTSKNSNSYPSHSAQYDDRFWENELEVKFLPVTGPSRENTIAGRVQVEPDRARRLIKQFQLIYKNGTPIPFDPKWKSITAVGFDTPLDERDVRIGAIPFREDFKPRYYNISNLKLNRSDLSLALTIRFRDPSSTAKESPPVLVAKWFLLDHRLADRYILCMDGKKIHYIHTGKKPDTKKATDTVVVCIHNLESGSKHNIEVIALHGNQETIRSVSIDFIVPSEIVPDTEIINVKEEVDQNDHPDDASPSLEEEQNETIISTTPHPPSTTPHPPSTTPYPRSTTDIKKPVLTFSCRCSVPHQSFPGIEHYISDADRSVRSRASHGQSPLTDQTPRSRGHDDNDDVVYMSQYY